MTIVEKLIGVVTTKLKFELDSVTDSNVKLKQEILRSAELNKTLLKEVSDLSVGEEEKWWDIDTKRAYVNHRTTNLTN